MAKKRVTTLSKESRIHHYRYWIVFVFVLLLYANTIPNYYSIDDDLVTTIDPQNPHRLTSKGITVIPEIFKEPYYKDNQGYAYDYRPIVLATFAIEHSLFGNSPHVSHFLNVLLYALLCVVLLKVLEALLRNYNPLLALACTLLFAAHPVHTDVVASIKSRDELLALFFMLIGCWFYFKTENDCKQKNLYYLFFIGLTVLAILSKPTAIVMLPILILLIVVHHKPKILPLLLLPIIPEAVFAVTQSSPIPLSWFLILVAAIWFITILFFVACYLPIINIKQRFLFLKQNLPSITNTNKAQPLFQSNFIAVSERVTWLLISFLVLLTVLLLFFEVPHSYFIIYFIIPLILNIRTHKYFEFILFLGFVFLSISGMVLGVKEENLLILLLLYTLSRRATKLNLIYGIYIAGIAVLSYYFTQITIGFLIFSVFLNFIILLNSKLIRYLLITLLLIIPAIVLLLIKGDLRAYEFQQIIFDVLMAYTVPIIAVLYLIGVKQKVIVWSSIFILAVGSFNAKVPNQLYNKNKVVFQTVKIINKKLPQVIEQNVYNRPIAYIEAVTDALSPVEYKLGTAAQVLRKYSGLLLVPYPLSFYYGYKIIDYQSGFEAKNILVLVIYILLGIAGLVFLRKQKIIAISILVMVIGISIYTNIFLAAPGMMADRFLFVPSLGFCLLLAYAILKICKQNIAKNSAKLDWQTILPNFKYTILVVLLVYSGLTIARNKDWKNAITLYSADIPHLQNSVLANNMYALALLKQSFTIENFTEREQLQRDAEHYFQQSLNIYPNFFNAQYDLARTQQMLGKDKDAEESYLKAFNINKKFPSAAIEAAKIALMYERYTDALNYYRLIPKDYIFKNQSALLTIGYIYNKSGKLDSSIYILKEGVKLYPQTADFFTATGDTYQKLHLKDSAIFYYEKSLLLNPANAQLKQVVLSLKENRAN